MSLVGIIVAAKFIIVFLITLVFGYGRRISVLTGTAMFHIGEFGFIIAQSGLNANLISDQNYSLIIASAIITMLLMPTSMGLASWACKKIGTGKGYKLGVKVRNYDTSSGLINPIVIAGYGRIGSTIAQGLRQVKIPFTVLEIDPARITELRKQKMPHVYGDCSNSFVLSHIGLKEVKTLVITYPDQIAVETTVKNVLRINPNIKIIARVHRPDEVKLVRGLGVQEIICPEYEAGLEFLKRTLTIHGVCADDVEKTIVSVFKKEIDAGKDPDNACKYPDSSI